METGIYCNLFNCSEGSNRDIIGFTMEAFAGSYIPIIVLILSVISIIISLLKLINNHTIP